MDRVTCPSARLFNFPVGIADLSRKPVGQFSTVQFYLPWYVKTVMEKPHSDFSIKIVINAFAPGYLLDSLRFVP